MRARLSISFWLLMAAAVLLPSCGGVANNPSPTITALSPSSVNAGSPAFTLTVTGSGFAPQSLIYWNNSPISTQFQSGSTLTAQIPISYITNPGSVLVEVQTPQPGGGMSLQLTFTINPVTSPVPTLTSISPTSAYAGSSSVIVRLFGTNFTTNSKVTINNQNQTPEFLDSQDLEVEIPGSYLTAAGAIQIGVLNPAPGGGSSGTRPLTLTYELPNAASVSPVSAAAGGTSQTLTVTGSGFVPASVVYFNGSARPTTFGSNTSITAALTPGDLAIAQVVQITVANPAPGGGTSTPALLFAVNGIVPTTTDPTYTGLPELVDYSYLGLAPNTGVGDLSRSGPTISSNGRYVAFASAASNLVDNDTNGQPDVFLRDTCYATASCTPSTQLVSVSGQGTSAGGSQANADSLEPSVNSAGTYVAFSSHATNLDPDFPNLTGLTRQVFLRSTCTGGTSTTTCASGFTKLVSVSSDAVNPANADATQPSDSPDGEYVAFVSAASNIISGIDPGGIPQVYLRYVCPTSTTTTCTPLTVLVSSPDGLTPANAAASEPSVAQGGLYVSFTSAATNLVNGVTPGIAQVYRDTTCVTEITSCQPVVTLVSSNDGTTPANAASGESSITSDGRYVAFASAATNLVPAASASVQQIYLRDTCGVVSTGCTTSTTLISVAPDNLTPANDLCESPSVSSSATAAGDGQFVAFASLATNLAANTTNGFENVFVRDTCNGASATTSCTPATSNVSASFGGIPANNVSLHPAVSGTGHAVAFLSPATNIVSNFANGLGDIFLAGTTF